MNIIQLSLFLVVALLPLSSSNPSKMAQAMSASFLDAKNKLSVHDDFDNKDHSISTNYIFGFLWCHDKNYCVPLHMALPMI